MSMPQWAHLDVREVSEHGREWLVCDACGAQWAKVEGDGPDEEIREGDGYCLEAAIRSESDCRRDRARDQREVQP